MVSVAPDEAPPRRCRQSLPKWTAWQRRELWRRLGILVEFNRLLDLGYNRIDAGKKLGTSYVTIWRWQLSILPGVSTGRPSVANALSRSQRLSRIERGQAWSRVADEMERSAATIRAAISPDT